VQITSETAEAHSKANESVLESESFRERLKELKHKLIKNEHDFKGVERDLEIATALAQSASHGANEVDVRYKSVLLTLDKTTTFGESIRDRSLRLQDKANRLSATATAKAQEFEDLNHESSVHELRLSKLSETIVALNLRMDDYLQVIGQRSNFYRTCQ